VKHLDKGLNPSSLRLIYFSGDYLLKGFRIGVVSGMVALTVLTYINPKIYVLLLNFDLICKRKCKHKSL